MNHSDKRKSLSYFEGIFDTASEGMLIVDASGHILQTNPAFDNLLGYKRSELKGKHFTEVIHTSKEVRKLTSLIKIHHFQRSRNLPLEIELMHKEEIAIPVRFRSVLLEDDTGEVVEAIGIVEDLRAHKGENDLKQKVQETQDTLLNLLANSGDAIMVANANGHITAANEALLQMLGYQEKEVIGKHVVELSPYEGNFTTTTGEVVSIAEEYVNYQVEKANELFEKGKVTNHTTYLIRKDGILVPVESTLSLLKDQNGERKGTIAICRDITEHKHAERKLRETKDHLDNVIQSSLDCIVVSDSKGNIIRVNKSFLELLGYKEEEVMGMHTAQFPPTEVGTYESTTGELVKLDEGFFNDSQLMITRLFEEGKIENRESYFIRKDRKVVPVEENIVLLYNEKGDMTGSVGIIRNITERRKADRKIKETKDFLESIIENSKDGIVIVDGKGYILSLNSALEAMSKFRKKELIGEHISVLAAEDKDVRKNIVDKTREMFEKGFATYEAVSKTKEGNYINIECNTSMIKDDKGNYIAGVSIIRDITERKEMEAKLFQSEKIRFLGELAGGVAHNFNNILAVIMGRANLLQMNIEAPLGMEERRKSVLALKRGLKAIEKASQEGAEVVRKIQEFTRDARDDEYVTPVNINKTIEDAIELTRIQWKDYAGSKGIKIEVKKDFSPIPFLTGNQLELKKVFINLIDNAIDAMPQGGNIKVKTFKQNNYIVASIEDTGVGIAEDKKDSIFDPFFTTKGPQSRGLGLSVSYGIINRHKGTIKVDSSEGKGTTFTIQFPLSKEHVETKIIKPMPETQRKAKVLVIEDEENICELFKDVLTEKGHQVETVSDGIEGTKLFEANEFDLVFTDLGMPRMSGWEVAEKIKGIDKSVPVFLMTGWNIEQKESEIKEKGVDLIIKKPFTMDQVLDIVQQGMLLRDQFKKAYQ